MVPKPNKAEIKNLENRVGSLKGKTNLNGDTLQQDTTEQKKSDVPGKEIDIYSNVYPDNPIIVWEAVFGYGIGHILGLYGLYLTLLGQVMWKTILFGFVSYVFATLGVLAGAHRLWSHRSFKAKFPLRLFLAIAQTNSYQLRIYDWVRDHRIHHKYSETLADPYNIKRGFFMAHFGWLVVRKHAAVFEKGRKVDMSDIEADSIVMSQKRYYKSWSAVFAFILPTGIPYYFWGESFLVSFVFNFSKIVFTVHCVCCINSFAHAFGNKPYDKSIDAAENKFVSIVSLGEGWHNYHHTFPWDYKADELGGHKYNISTCFIDLMAKLGQAYDLKTVPKHMIEKRVQRTGDGSHCDSHVKSL